MNKLFLKKQIANLLLASVAFLLIPSTFAAKMDLEQEVKITAKSQASDLKSRVLSYIDNVLITQGSVVIKADLAQVYTQADSNKVYILQGKPAIFEQTLEDGEKVRLEANEIRYEPSVYLVTITDNARFISPVSDVRASKITYNTLTETQEAASNNDEIVTTILKPAILKNKKAKK